jgi:hypothetical protein
MKCTGNGKDHCCYLGKYGVCKYLEENTVPGRHWACGLLRENGTWEKMYKDPRYSDVRVKLTDCGVKENCCEWPPVGGKCNGCGLINNGNIN